MNRYLILVVALFLMLGGNGQNAADAAQELSAKEAKASKKEAKGLEKEGWRVAADEGSLEKQVNRIRVIQSQRNDKGALVYILGKGQVVDDSFDAAKKQALQIAVQNVVSQVLIQINSKVEHAESSQQIDANLAALLVKLLVESKNLVVRKMEKSPPVLEISRTTINQQTEILLVLAYNAENVTSLVKKMLVEELKKKGVSLNKPLMGILGL